MAYNKVIYDGNTLIDLTEDTVTSDNLIEGLTAHNSKGEAIVGTMKRPTVTYDGNGKMSISGLTIIVN